MALFDTVPRELHESTVRLLQDQLESATQRHERDVTRLEGSLEAERTRYAELVKQLVEIKRHEQGMSPEGFDASSLMPEHGLGPKTIAACDEFAAGDPELRRYLVGIAHKEYRKRADMDADEKDVQVAKVIAAGET